jgi:PhnB protein
MSVKPIPDGYHSVTPYLIVKDAAAALEFYHSAFNAEEIMRLSDPSGGIMHCEFKIGDSHIMMANEFPDMGYFGPQTLGGSPVTICLYVENVDEMFRQAIEAGGVEIKPVEDQFYGDRSGTLKDPSGHVWTITTHIKDLTPTEIEERFKQMCS